MPDPRLTMSDIAAGRQSLKDNFPSPTWWKTLSWFLTLIAFFPCLVLALLWIAGCLSYSYFHRSSKQGEATSSEP